MKKNLRLLPSALLCACALTADLSLIPQGTCFGGGAVKTAAAAALALIVSLLLQRAADGKRIGTGGALCALVMALVRTVSGIFAGGNNAFPVDYAGLAAVSLCGSFLFFRSLTAVCFSLFDRTEKETLTLSRAKIALILFACTLPYFVITWPGAVHPDTYDELQQVMGTLYPNKVICGTALVCGANGNNLINGFQPVLHTLLVGGFYALFRALGNGMAGITLFLVLQSAVAAWVVSGGIVLLRRMGAGKKTLIAVILFYGLFPLFPDYLVTTMKDSAFGIALLSMLLFASELTAFPEETAKRPLKLVGGALSVLLTGLLRSYGLIIAAVVFVPALLRLYKRSRAAFAKGAVSAFAGIALCAVTLYAVYPACGIPSAPASEKRSILFQGAALYQKEYPEDVAEEDRALLRAVCGTEDAGKLYDPLDADKVKTGALLYHGDIREFDALCLRFFMSHPAPFFRAAMTMEADYLTTCFTQSKTDVLLYGGDHAHDRTLGDTVIPAETEGYVEVSQGKYTLALSHYMKRVVDFMTNIPGIALLFESGTYLCLAFIALTYQLRGRRTGKILPFAIILFGLSLFLSPIGGSSRYAFPIYLCAPLIALIAAKMPERA